MYSLILNYAFPSSSFLLHQRVALILTDIFMSENDHKINDLKVIYECGTNRGRRHQKRIEFELVSHDKKYVSRTGRDKLILMPNSSSILFSSSLKCGQC